MSRRNLSKIHGLRQMLLSVFVTVGIINRPTSCWCNQGMLWICWKNWVFPKQIGVGPPNHPILIGFSIINHPFWGFSPYFWKHPSDFQVLVLMQVLWNLTGPNISRSQLPHSTQKNISQGRAATSEQLAPWVYIVIVLLGFVFKDFTCSIYRFVQMPCLGELVALS